MRKGLPATSALCTAFGRRAKLALQYQAFKLGDRRTQADVLREFQAMTGDAVNDATVSRWFSGAFWPADPRHQLALARVLGVDVGWLFFGDHSQAPGIELEPPRRASGRARE